MIRARSEPRSRALTVFAEDLLGFEERDVFHGRALVGNRSFRFKQDHRGARLVDLIYGALILNVASSRFVECMERAGINGYKTYPAVIDLADGTELTDYSVLAITGKAGPVDWKKTPVEPARTESGIPLGGHDYVGLAFDVKTWDGSDFFTTKGNAYVIGTDRVVEVIETAKLTNIRCTPLSEYRSVYDGDEF